MGSRCNRQPAFAYAPKPSRQPPQTGLASGSWRILSCSKLSAARHSKQSSSGAFQVGAPCRACCRRGAGACGHPRSRFLRALARLLPLAVVHSDGARADASPRDLPSWPTREVIRWRTHADTTVRPPARSPATAPAMRDSEGHLTRRRRLRDASARCECERPIDIVRASLESACRGDDSQTVASAHHCARCA